MSQVVVVTGASAGVGRAIVRAFAERHAHIGLLARGLDGLEGARREVEQAGGRALVLPTDVADAEQVEAAAQAVEQEFGPIDIWVNDAMTTVMGRAWEVTPQEYRRVTEVSYLGYVHGTLTALKRMMPRDRGSIINVGSAMGYHGVALMAPYCASKGAAKNFTEGVRIDLLAAGSNVHVGICHLPGHNTPQYTWIRAKVDRHPRPVPPPYQPEVAARAVLFLADSKRREVWVALPSVAAILGGVLAPELTDRLVAFLTTKTQLARRPINTEGRDNLYEPIPGDHGARGEFDREALPFSPQLWATVHRRVLVGAAAGMAAAGAAVRGLTR